MTPLVIPELDVSNLDRSLSFYRTILGFQTHVERPEERFAYLIRGRVHLMLQEAQGPGRRFRTAPLKYPFGRGINLQLEVPDVNHLHSEAVEAGATLHIQMEQRWYRLGVEESGHRHIVWVAQDGYLPHVFN